MKNISKNTGELLSRICRQVQSSYSMRGLVHFSPYTDNKGITAIKMRLRRDKESIFIRLNKDFTGDYSDYASIIKIVNNILDEEEGE